MDGQTDLFADAVGVGSPQEIWGEQLRSVRLAEAAWGQTRPELALPDLVRS
jgi:hypothetical protein